MGMAISVRVEGDPELPIEVRGDEKLLMDVIEWAGVPEHVQALQLSPSTVTALLRVDSSAYGSEEEPVDAWQDPTILAGALNEVRTAVKNASKAGLLARQRFTFIRRDSYEWYDQHLEDAVRICDWAHAHDKHVALTAW